MDEIGIDLPESDANTIGGLVVERIGRIPTTNEQVMLGQHEVTILEAEPTRIRMVLFKKGDLDENEIADTSLE